MLFLLQWRAGLRVSEALDLEVEDVNLRGNQPSIRVVSGKGGKPREVPVHQELVVTLQFYMCAIKRGRLFPGISRPTAHRRFKEAMATAQRRRLIGPKRGCSNHTLRHSAARHWLVSGVPINVVSAWLGHANLSTTMV